MKDDEVVMIGKLSVGKVLKWFWDVCCRLARFYHMLYYNLMLVQLRTVAGVLGCVIVKGTYFKHIFFVVVFPASKLNL